MANSSLKNKTDSQLRELAASLQQAADYCVQQQGQFWGQGFTEGADMFEKNGEDLAKQAQTINDELQSRREANMSEAEKKAIEDEKKANDGQTRQATSTLPPNLAPADQPTPATQPIELSTEQQQKKQQGGSSSSSSSSTTKDNKESNSSSSKY